MALLAPALVVLELAITVVPSHSLQWKYTPAVLSDRVNGAFVAGRIRGRPDMAAQTERLPEEMSSKTSFPTEAA
jgi:hypothetical protein